jgi:hypothetical protein
MTNHKRVRITGRLKADDFWQISSPLVAGYMDVSGAVQSLGFESNYVSMFGVDPIATAIVWNKIGIDEAVYDEDKGVEPIHLLWSLMFLKLYGKEAQLISLAAKTTPTGTCDNKTYRKYSRFILERLNDLYPDVVSCCFGFHLTGTSMFL